MRKFPETLAIELTISHKKWFSLSRDQNVACHMENLFYDQFKKPSNLEQLTTSRISS